MLVPFNIVFTFARKNFFATRLRRRADHLLLVVLTRLLFSSLLPQVTQNAFIQEQISLLGNGKRYTVLSLANMELSLIHI